MFGGTETTWPKGRVLAWMAAVMALSSTPSCDRAMPETNYQPTPIAWGQDPCASCRMVVADPPFAAQAVRDDGTVATFDDLGCVVIELATGRLDARTIAFRHLHEDRWLTKETASFVRHPTTPMAFGYAAVDLEQGELSFEQIQREMEERFQLTSRRK